MKLRILKNINESLLIAVRCSEEHPHHSLPQLLALANSDKDEEIINQNIKTSNRKKKDSKVSEVFLVLSI